MPLRAITFAITDLALGRRLALALICPEARYASIACRGAERLDRRCGTPGSGSRLKWTCRSDCRRLPLESTSWTVDVLLDANRRRGLVVQHMSVLPIEVERVEMAVTKLDTLLRSQDPASAAKTSI
jgi:hypothetical protein